jgi:hypothetical protein
VGDGAGLAKVVDGAGVDVAGLQADDRRPCRLGRQGALERADVDRPVPVGGHWFERA